MRTPEPFWLHSKRSAECGKSPSTDDRSKSCPVTCGHWPYPAGVPGRCHQPQAVKGHDPGSAAGRASSASRPCSTGIQQACRSQPLFDPDLRCEHGFRPDRRAHRRSASAQAYAGRSASWLTSTWRSSSTGSPRHADGTVGQRIADRSVLRADPPLPSTRDTREWVVIERHEGTPQGGPLTAAGQRAVGEVDKELEWRGHVRGAPTTSTSMYGRSGRRAGDDPLRKLFGKLKLRVNETKSKVTRATNASSSAQSPRRLRRRGAGGHRTPERSACAR